MRISYHTTLSILFKLLIAINVRRCSTSLMNHQDKDLSHDSGSIYDQNVLDRYNEPGSSGRLPDAGITVLPQIKLAMEHFEQAINQSPTDPSLYYNLMQVKLPFVLNSWYCWSLIDSFPAYECLIILLTCWRSRRPGALPGRSEGPPRTLVFQVHAAFPIPRQ